MQSHGFAKAALHTIPHHCLAERFRDGEPDLRTLSDTTPILCGLTLKAERREVWARVARSLVIDFAEVGAAKNSDSLWELVP